MTDEVKIEKGIFAADAKPIVYSYIKPLLEKEGYVVKRGNFERKSEDMRVSWRVTMSSAVDFHRDPPVYGVRINFVIEEWFEEIFDFVKLPYMIGKDYREGYHTFLDRFDIDREDSNPIIYWSAFSVEDLERLRPSIERETLDLIAFFNRRSDPVGFAKSVFGIRDDGKPAPMDGPIECMVALFRLGRAEGPGNPLLNQIMRKWHALDAERLVAVQKFDISKAGPKIKLGSKGIQKLGPNWRDWERRLNDPIYNWVVLTRQQNELLQQVAAALDCSADDWLIPIPKSVRDIYENS